MRFLLDTHTFLWWVTDDRGLSPTARDVISEGANEIVFSAVSGWEIAIKARLGRVRLAEDPEGFFPAQLRANSFAVLPISLRHALGVHSLPDLHRDPFDRLLVSQAIAEDLPIISGDEQLRRYAVEVVW